MEHSLLVLLSSLNLLDSLTSFSSKPFTSVHSLRGGTRRFSYHYDSEVDGTRLFPCHYDDTQLFPCHYDSEVDFLPEIITIFIIDMGCQQTILQLNESSFQSQSFIKINTGSRHNLFSSDMSSIEAHTSNMSFLYVPGTSSSLKAAEKNIQDPFSYRSTNPNFVPVTSSASSVDPIIVPRMIPRYVTVLETSQDTKFSM